MNKKLTFAGIEITSSDAVPQNNIACWTTSQLDPSTSDYYRRFMESGKPGPLNKSPEEAEGIDHKKLGIERADLNTNTESK